MESSPSSQPALIKRRSGRIVIIMAIVAVVGILATIFISSETNTRERNYLLSLAKTAVTAIDPNEIIRLQGTRADIANPAYVRLKAIMTQQRDANADVRFVYLFGLRDEKMYFMMDSEPANSPDYSAPGDIYDDTTALELESYRTGVPIVEGPTRDDWGEWVSALVPLADPQTGETIAMLGMDIGTTNLHQRVRSAAVLPAAFSLIVLTILFAYFLSTRRNEMVDRTKTEFVTLAAHQLRTPLTSIGWYAEMLLNGDSGPLTDQQRDALKEVQTSNRRMVNIVGALLNVTRSDMGTLSSDPKPIDIVHIADEVIEEFTNRINERSLVIQKRYPAESIIINADQQLIRIVLENLLSNAIKYTSEHGTITISISRDERMAHIAIADTGYGIPKNQQAKVFTKLFRADNIRQHDTDGSGLGLYLVKSIVATHGGNVWFASVENKGSTFYVDLPCAGPTKIA